MRRLGQLGQEGTATGEVVEVLALGLSFTDKYFAILVRFWPSAVLCLLVWIWGLGGGEGTHHPPGISSLVVERMDN